MLGSKTLIKCKLNKVSVNFTYLSLAMPPLFKFNLVAFATWAFCMLQEQPHAIVHECTAWFDVSQLAATPTTYVKKTVLGQANIRFLKCQICAFAHPEKRRPLLIERTR